MKAAILSILVALMAILSFSCSTDMNDASQNVMAAAGQTTSPALDIAQIKSEDPDTKWVLAVVGDAWHRVAPLDRLLVSPLRENGWKAVVVMDYNVPWDELASFDLIIQSREGREYVQYYRNRDLDPEAAEPEYWLTPEQEMKYVEYVQNGGNMFLYHDGFGNYECGRGVSQVAKSCFIRHPAIVDITVTPTGKRPDLTEGVTEFVVADEEYEVNMDESEVEVFLESHSPEHGRAPQGWAHTLGEGKVAVLIPGHHLATIQHPMIVQLVQNCLDWLTEE